MKAVGLARMGGIGAALAASLTGVFFFTVLDFSYTHRAFSVNTWHAIGDYALALMGLFMLAVIPAVSARVVHLSEGWVRWTSTVALIGAGLLAVTSLWQAEYELSVSEGWVDLPSFDLPPQAPEATADVWNELLLRMPRGWLETAGIGLWVLTVSRLALLNGSLPEWLAHIGIGAGLTSFFTPLGALLQVPTLHLLGLVASGLLFMPLWLMWTAFELLREQDAPITAEHYVPTATGDGPATLPEAPAGRRWANRHPRLAHLWPPHHNN